MYIFASLYPSPPPLSHFPFIVLFHVFSSLLAMSCSLYYIMTFSPSLPRGRPLSHKKYIFKKLLKIQFDSSSYFLTVYRNYQTITNHRKVMPLYACVQYESQNLDPTVKSTKEFQRNRYPVAKFNKTVTDH